MVTTTVNVGDCQPTQTPGTYHVRAHYADSDAGYRFGPFASREKAEECLLAVAKRTDVKKAELEAEGA